MSFRCQLAPFITELKVALTAVDETRNISIFFVEKFIQDASERLANEV
jgi:hypothetical protein